MEKKNKYRILVKKELSTTILVCGKPKILKHYIPQVDKGIIEFYDYQNITSIYSSLKEAQGVIDIYENGKMDDEIIEYQPNQTLDKDVLMSDTDYFIKNITNEIDNLKLKINDFIYFIDDNNKPNMGNFVGIEEGDEIKWSANGDYLEVKRLIKIKINSYNKTYLKDISLVFKTRKELVDYVLQNKL